MSIKNNVASSISHIYSFSNLLKKTIYHTVNVIPTEAELFAIRYSINQAVQVQHVSHIIVIMNAIHIVKKIFDLVVHLYQQQAIIIFKNLKAFLNKHDNNSIEFWNCPNNK